QLLHHRVPQVARAEACPPHAVDRRADRRHRGPDHRAGGARAATARRRAPPRDRGRGARGGAGAARGVQARRAPARPPGAVVRGDRRGPQRAAGDRAVAHPPRPSTAAGAPAGVPAMTGPRRELDERFADWVDGRLRPAERAALEAEMARDPELQRAAEEYRRSVQLLRSALAPGEYGPSIADAVLARVGPAPAAPPRAWRPYLASAMAAAALVLVFIVIRSIPPAPEASVESIAQSPSGVIPSGDLAGVRTVQEEAAATGEQEPPAATADRAVVAEGGVQPPPEAERVPARGAV